MSNKFIQFSCGCIIDENFTPNINSIKLDCPATIDLIKSGNTIGVFQVESWLGITSCKKIKPDNLEEISDVISLMRPGPLEGEIDGKSIYNHYIDRKSGKEESVQPIEALNTILKDTYNLLLYQEQSLKLATEIAGFTLEDADIKVRKGIGKKIPEILAGIEKSFIEGATKLGKVTQEQAKEIFEWIRSSQRYQFNRSHSLSYAAISYITAYLKAHFPLEFYCESLNHAWDQEEIRKFIYDAYYNDIQIYPPDLFKLNSDFIIKDNNIYFGLSHIKGLGDACIRDLVAINNKTPFSKMIWMEILFHVLTKIKKTCVEALLSVGAINIPGITREKQLYDYSHIRKLTEKEINWVQKYCPLNENNLIDILKKVLEAGSGKGKPMANKNRVNNINGLIHSLEEPSYSLDDLPSRLMPYEESLLGVSFIGPSHTQYIPNSCSCLEIKKEVVNGIIYLPARTLYIKEYENKRGKIGYLGIYDETAELRGVKLYTKAWEKHKEKLRPHHNYIFIGKLDKAGSLIVENVETFT